MILTLGRNCTDSGSSPVFCMRVDWYQSLSVPAASVK